MAKLKINAVAISNARGFATNAKTTTGSVADGVASIQRGIQSEVAARNNIAYRLSNIQSNVAQIENDIQAIYQTIDIAVAKYNNAERQIVGWAQQVANGYRPTNYSNNRDAFAAAQFDRMTKKELLKEKIANQGMKASEEEKFDWKIDDLVFDVVGEAGVVGKGIGEFGAATADIYKGYKNGNKYDIYKGTVGLFDGLVSQFGDVAKNSCKVGVDWKEVLLGNWEKGSALKEIEKIKKTQGTDDVVEALVLDKVDEFNLSKTTDFGEKLSVGAKWAGTALSFIGNGIENIEELNNGEISEGRAVMETITETAVDVVIDIGATAAVGAAAVAIGFTGPAIAVGAVATAVVWGADALTRWATTEITGEEKGLTELVSDTILDVGEAVLESGKDVIVDGINTVKGIGKAISNVGNAIGTQWRVSFG